MDLKNINRILTDITFDIAKAIIENLKKENDELKAENKKLLNIINSLIKKNE